MDYYPDMHSNTIEDRLDVVVRMLQAASDLSHAARHPSIGTDTFGYSKGRKYARVYYDMSNGQRFVAFFVDMVTGDVWKADGWNKPTLNFVRGNIMNVEGRCALIGDRMAASGFHFYPVIA